MKYPFEAPENTAVITCCHITENYADILYVSHDEDDGIWQFLCGESHNSRDARIVSLGEVFSLDNTIFPLGEMPCGYVAQRKSKDSNWNIKKR